MTELSRPEPVSGDGILVVEDDPNSRETLVDILETEGYRVTGVANGLEALRQLRERPTPCLILLDLRMPVMDGWQFRQHQQQDPAIAAIPVIAMTGVGDRPEQAFSLAAAGYFLKPYNVNLLLETVALYCRKSAGPVDGLNPVSTPDEPP